MGGAPEGFRQSVAEEAPPGPFATVQFFVAPLAAWSFIREAPPNSGGRVSALPKCADRFRPSLDHARFSESAGLELGVKVNEGEPG